MSIKEIEKIKEAIRTLNQLRGDYKTYYIEVNEKEAFQTAVFYLNKIIDKELRERKKRTDICIICGKTFQTYHRTKLTCSWKCRMEDKRMIARRWIEECHTE